LNISYFDFYGYRRPVFCETNVIFLKAVCRSDAKLVLKILAFRKASGGGRGLFIFKGKIDNKPKEDCK